MPSVIAYENVQQRMRDGGYVSLYHNSGAFGFAAKEGVIVRGWIGPEDPTIREAARRFIDQVPPPYEQSLADLLGKIVQTLSDDIWLMPKSHWHYEMHFGNRELLEALLPTIGIDPATLRERNNGSAIAFAKSESEALKQTVHRLLEGLLQSDFLLAWPGAQTLCTIHHHKQLWWQTRDEAVFALLQSATEQPR